VYKVLRIYTKLDKFRSWKQQSRLKFNFCAPTKKRFVVLFWTFHIF